MAIFGSSTPKKEQIPVASDSKSATLMTQCMQINGDIKGCGAIHIDGIVHGNVDVEESIVIGKSGKVFGDLRSKKIIISGEHKGKLECHTLEVTQSGIVSHEIKADEVISDGKIDAILTIKEKIHVTKNGTIMTDKLQSRFVIVNGHIEGNISASELLEINQDGHVKGEMTVKKIKVAEGGLMLGTMLTYHKDEDTKATLNEKSVKAKAL